MSSINDIKQNFLKLKTREDVAELLGIKERSLRYFLYKRRPENMYHTFELRKRDGTFRTISAPNKELKNIQRKLSEVLSNVYEPKVCAYGFVKTKSILNNASQHTKRALVFNIDLKDFFTQIHFGRIRGMLMNPPYSIGEEAATTIAQIACVNGVLPQGAPSSPIITNMICAPLDNSLMRLAKKSGCVYTRYADDITFSSFKKTIDPSIAYIDGDMVVLGDKLSEILKKHSFFVNNSKISLRPKHMRQEVTGLTVNEFANVRRSFVKNVRAILHSCEKYGIYDSAKEYVEKGLCKNDFINCVIDNPKAEEDVCVWFESVIKGKINYIKQIKGDNSLTYLSYAKKANQIFNKVIFDIAELDRLDYLVNNSTFILYHEDSENMIQGSAFYVKELGIFTGYHVTESEDWFDVYFSESFEEERVGMIGKSLNEVSSDKSIDYALYRLDLSKANVCGFELGNSYNINVRDKVIVVGYPNHQKGNSPFIQSCSITSKKEYLGASFFTTSGRIVHGMSGGVVLNEQLEAIGIIKGGIASLEDDETNENQGFIPIHLAIEHMKKHNV